MLTYKAPGVYFERRDSQSTAISALRTDVAAFVGITQRGPLHLPVAVHSWRQFKSYFGDCVPYAYLAYAVRAFFENGGKRCRVVRVAHNTSPGGAQPATSGIFRGTSGNDIWRIAASSPGTWGNGISFSIRETSRAQTNTVPVSGNNPFSYVDSISGFGRGTLVRLTRGGNLLCHKVVSAADHHEGRQRLVWEYISPDMRLPYDSPLTVQDTGKPIFIESVEYTLFVREHGKLVGLYENLSLIPESDTYGPRILGDFFPRNEENADAIETAPKPVAILELRDIEKLEKRKSNPGICLQALHDDTLSRQYTELGGGTDGLSLLSPDDFIGHEILPSDDIDAGRLKRKGISALSDITEVSMVAVPDVHIRPAPRHRRMKRELIPDPCFPDQSHEYFVTDASVATELPPQFSNEQIFLVQAALIRQCESKKDRVALLDAPRSESAKSRTGLKDIQSWRKRFDSKYAALYYPWVRISDPIADSGNLTRDIPPTGHVAGQIAAADLETGVHKAPANRPLAWVEDLAAHIGESEHEILNPLGINVLRSFRDRGFRVYGARTVSSDPDWRYVNVRRLMIMIEQSLYLALQWASFEPNNVYTRSKIQLSVSSYLIALWQQRALAGKSREEAFYVKCDEENNPPRERDQGRLLVEVGVAPSLPYEFIIFRIGRASNEFEVTESMTSAGGV